MLFNSFLFIFAFLPAALILTYGAGRWRQDAAKLVLAVLSLAFYAYWRPIYLPLLLFSIVFNYIVGGLIQKAYEDGRQSQTRSWLIFGILVDVLMLGWFKYAEFLWTNINLVVGSDFTLTHVALPLAISFFTFQKIAYLIDSARGDAKRMRFLDFTLFAAFFPQLIAGPIVHYAEIVPQLNTRLWGRLISRNLMVGLVIFAIGLFKKTVIADTLADYANQLFDVARSGQEMGLATGWLAAITYTLQLYFDFSGYSDMAIGLGRMLGVKLPLNFHSPLRASGIIEYWRRWHMTLQRFIVAYVFQPLSIPLNRMAARRGLSGWPAFGFAIFIPSFITFVVVGIWHGAGWTFVGFGVMHAIYVCTNEAWRERTRRRRRAFRKAKREWQEPGVLELAGYHVITLVAVVFANVLFRAHSVGDALYIWQAMSGFAGSGVAVSSAGIDGGLFATLAIGILLIAFAPNTQQIMGRFDPAYNWKDWRDVAVPKLMWTWKPDLAGISFAGLALFLGIIFIQRGQAVFLYFNF